MQFASPHLKDDKDLVLAAVQQDGRSLQHASERLQLDPELSSASGWLRSLPFPWSKNHLLPGPNQLGEINRFASGWVGMSTTTG